MIIENVDYIMLTEEEAKETFQEDEVFEEENTDEDFDYDYDDVVITDSVKLYLQEISRIPLLTPEAEKALGYRILEGDTKAKEELVEHNLKLVVSIAKKYCGCGLPLLDLIQEGSIGLMTAAARFDVRKGFRFTTYATWWVRQAISNALTSQSRQIRIPAHINIIIRKVKQASISLTQTLHREPTIEEISAEIGIPVDKITVAMDMSKAVSSLEAPLNDDGESCIADCIASDDEDDPIQNLMNEFNEKLLNRIFSTLGNQEATVLKMRFGIEDGQPKTLEAVGEHYGVSKERIRQIEIKALRKLRHPMRMTLLRELAEAMNA